MGSWKVDAKVRTDVRAHRTPCYDISPLYVNRWSPRAMTGERLAEDEFMPLFAAARWAPSAYNNQPWRFLYATRGDGHWDTYLDLVSDANRTWARRAAMLVAILSKTTFDHNGEPSRTHAFDTGAAWQNLALEGDRRGLVVHGIGGFDHERATAVLDIPSEYTVEAMAAIGIRAPAEVLPDELQEREIPSDRKPLADIVVEGTFVDAGNAGAE